MALITCENLTLGYEGQIILSDLNFKVSDGEYLCIVGENGSGKTTLMRTILGLRNPMNGRILFQEGLRQNEIGYLPQQTAIQRDFPASVTEIVLSGFQGQSVFHSFYRKEEKRQAAAWMERLDILSLQHRCYRELSGGQQQRVLLARALCATKKVLLLDEPISGLDPFAAQEMYRLIADLNQSYGITVIMISHDIAGILRDATHILHVGNSVFYGSKEDYLNSEEGKHFTKEADIQ